MAGTNTSVVAVKQALKALLADSLSVQVEYGWPGDTVQRKSVYIGDVEGALSIPSMKAGRKRRDENYRVDVAIDLIKTAGTQLQAETEAFAIFDELDDALANDPSLGGLVNAMVLDDFTSKTGFGDKEAYCRITVAVAISNRLN